VARRFILLCASTLAFLAVATAVRAQLPVPAHPPGTVCFTPGFWCWAQPPGPPGAQCSCQTPSGPVAGFLG